MSLRKSSFVKEVQGAILKPWRREIPFGKKKREGSGGNEGGYSEG